MRASGYLFVVVCLILSAPLGVVAEEYAFIVGIGGYDEKQLTPLGEYPRNDAIEFRDVLIESGFKKDNVVLMVDDLEVLPKTRPAGRYLPEASKIRQELQLLLPALERDDTLIVALAGHGVQFKGEQEPYFCPLDARLDDKESLISLTWLYDQLSYDSKTNSGCKPRKKLLLIDACRNDPASRIFRDASGGPGLASVTLPQLAPLPEGVVALFSCAEGQQALQHEPIKHGIFFYHVLEGWKGQADGDRDQKVTLDEIIAYTKSQTQTYARLNLAAPQTPRQKGYFDGLWELRSLSDVSLLINNLGMKLKLIPAGDFLMGSLDSEEGHQDDESPQHRVRITKPFFMGIHEVTKGQFAQFVREADYRTEPELDGEGGYGWNETKGEFEGRDPKYTWKHTGFPYEDDHPVVNVTWNDAVAFCEWLSRKEGRACRLPTEAEWEYACRAGTTTLYQHGKDPEGLALVGNVADGTAKTKFSAWNTINARDGHIFTAPVGKYRPNAFGLYDTVGNVWEWCSDWYGADYYASSPERDPRGPS
ncbi:MAG: SUMF1/EgtB/PvdO family nonheme iron enzyme, partial [Planctomycetaceae bacterium]|nr:SUMF1/EgtB/PvdO family nonheme iron enzyme [Planctomycetaceae bacterium]